MSYATLYHDNWSRHVVSQLEANYSNPSESDPGSDSGSAMDIDEQGDLDEDFELEDLPGSPRYSGPTSGLVLGDSHSDMKGSNLGELTSRRPSASTLQSFMLYTPYEERSVIKKFDRRLVMFVALLYMLSFLDRSSMSLRLICCSGLTTVRYRECKDCRLVGGLTSKLVAIRMATTCLLHHLHSLRMDDFAVESVSSAYLSYVCPLLLSLFSCFLLELTIPSLYMRSFMGSHCLNAIHRFLVHISPCSSSSSWNRGGSIRWRSLFHVILLQAR